MKHLEDELRAAGIEAEILGPGLERDEWQLVVGGQVVATGFSYGTFEKAVERWRQKQEDRPSER